MTDLHERGRRGGGRRCGVQRARSGLLSRQALSERRYSQESFLVASCTFLDGSFRRLAALLSHGMKMTIIE